jgi:hypothetical protein
MSETAVPEAPPETLPALAPAKAPPPPAGLWGLLPDRGDLRFDDRHYEALVRLRGTEATWDLAYAQAQDFVAREVGERLPDALRAHQAALAAVPVARKRLAAVEENAQARREALAAAEAKLALALDRASATDIGAAQRAILLAAEEASQADSFVDRMRTELGHAEAAVRQAWEAAARQVQREVAGLLRRRQEAAERALCQAVAGPLAEALFVLFAGRRLAEDGTAHQPDAALVERLVAEAAAADRGADTD